MANRGHALRLLQCITVAIRPLRVEELAEILALDFEDAEGATPKLHSDWQWEDRQRAVLSTCSSLITLVDNGGSRVIQFSHFSVKEFLTSDRLATSRGDVSYLHIMAEPAHATLAQACLGILLQLDHSSSTNQVQGSFPLARYARRYWVEHAKFGMVSSRIEVGMRRLFDSAQPYFAAWLQLYDIDHGWPQFTAFQEITDLGSPLYYASLCGFRDLADHIIVKHPEQVNERSGLNYSPLVAALYKRHFDVAELLHQRGAAVDPVGPNNRTPLQVASMEGLIDVVRWLLGHGADSDSRDDKGWTPIILAAGHGHLEIIRMLLGYGVRINAAINYGYTPLSLASCFGYVDIARLLLQHGADISARDKDCSTPLHMSSSRGMLETTCLLLDHVADTEAENKDGRTPLHLALFSRKAEVVRLLLRRGANANAADNNGWTPLHLASFLGKPETVRLLLDHGANADAKDKEGTTPFQLASEQRKDEIVLMLTEHRAQADREP